MTATAGARLNSANSNFKNGKTRLLKALESAGDEEAAAMKEELRALLGEDTEEGAALPDSSEAIEILSSVQQQGERDYSALLSAFQRQAEAAQKVYDNATSDDIRLTQIRRIETLNEVTRIVEAASKIPAEPRTFGCKRLPRNKVSGRGTGFPDIQFRHHIFRTSDPLEIARLLDYTVNPKKGDAPIEELPNGMVALVSNDSSEFATWISGLNADDMIRNMKGAIRRPFR